jgi:hypothetical protein
MPSPLRNKRSASASIHLTRPLTRLTPMLVGQDPPWNPTWQEWLHCHPLISLPKPRRGSEAHAPGPRLTGRTTRWAHNLSGTCGTHTTVSIVAGGDTIVIPRGEGLRHLETTPVMCHSYYPSRHCPTPSRTPLRSYAVSLPSMPPATRRPKFA